MKTKTFVSIRFVVKAGLIGAMYMGLTMALAPLAFGPFQIRISDMVMIFPFIFGWAGWAGLFIGGFFTNFFGPYGIMDVFLGTICAGLVGNTAILYLGKISLRRHQEEPWLFLALMIPPISIVFWIGYLLLHKCYGVALFPMIPWMIFESSLTCSLGGFLIYKALKRLKKGKIGELWN